LLILSQEPPGQCGEEDEEVTVIVGWVDVVDVRELVLFSDARRS